MALSLDDFLISRGLEKLIDSFEAEKIDNTTLLLMKDEDLKQYVPKLGDRIALQEFCKSANNPNRLSLIAKVREKVLQKESQPSGVNNQKSNCKSKKITRKIEIGWMHYQTAIKNKKRGYTTRNQRNTSNGENEEGDYVYVRNLNGGGTRVLSVPATWKKAEIQAKALQLFFPGGVSRKGNISDFEIDVLDFGKLPVDEQLSISKFFEVTKNSKLRFYLATKDKKGFVAPKKDINTTSPGCSSRYVLSSSDLDSGSDCDTTSEFKHDDQFPVIFEDFDSNVYTDTQLHENHQSDASFTEYLTDYSTENPPRNPVFDRNEASSSSRRHINDQPSTSSTVTNVATQPAEGFGLNLDFGLNEYPPTVPTNILIPTLPIHSEELKIEINRSSCMKTLFELYVDETIIGKKLVVTFIGETGVDGGGLTKEMFNLFFETIENTFFRGEDTIVPFLPLNRVRKDKEKMIIIGRIIQHMLLLTGSIPTKLSKTNLYFIGNPDKIVDTTDLLEDFFLFVTPCERQVLKKALDNFSDMNSKERDILFNIFQSNNFFDIPREEEIDEQITSIAMDVIVEKPRQFLELIRKGIDLKNYETFWRNCNFSVFFNIQKPTSDKVVNCLSYDEPLTNEQLNIMHFLQMYIRCMDNDFVRKFLFFVTGSFHMPEKIQVSFNNQVGLARRPIVSTCANLIELSTNYVSYQDFKRELNICLLADEAYVYNSY